MLQFEIKAGGGVPAGFYRSRFLAVEATQHEEYGDGLKFVFEVIDGEHAGEQGTRITGPSPTPKNAAGRMIAGLLGAPLTPGAKVDLSPCVGKAYLISVEEVKSGQGTRVVTVMPADGKPVPF